jgi:hypothetical protein
VIIMEVFLKVMRNSDVAGHKHTTTGQELRLHEFLGDQAPTEIFQ